MHGYNPRALQVLVNCKDIPPGACERAGATVLLSVPERGGGPREQAPGQGSGRQQEDSQVCQGGSQACGQIGRRQTCCLARCKSRQIQANGQAGCQASCQAGLQDPCPRETRRNSISPGSRPTSRCTGQARQTRQARESGGQQGRRRPPGPTTRTGAQGQPVYRSLCSRGQTGRPPDD